jgi:hypothetical protein
VAWALHPWRRTASRGRSWTRQENCDASSRWPPARWSAITQLEVSRRRSNRGKVIGLGALAGAVVGGAIGLADEPDCRSGDFLCMKGASTAAGVIIGAPVGALIGLAFSHGERWESTSSDGLRVAIAPMKGGGAVRLSFRF